MIFSHEARTMAARIRKIRHDDQTRAKIQTSQLINRLTSHALGKVEMLPSQVTAALGCSRRHCPTCPLSMRPSTASRRCGSSPKSRLPPMNGNNATPSQQMIWAPQAGPQKALIDCPLPEVFFGGARGGGKTDGVLGKWALKEQRYGEHFNAVMFRRTTVSAEDAIERSKQIYGPLGARFNESKLRWRMANGGRVSFAYLDSVDDAQEYQGRNVTDAWIEEAGQFPTSQPIDRLQAVLRSAAGVPTQLILTANPGGPGQHWVKERYRLHPFPFRPLTISRDAAQRRDAQGGRDSVADYRQPHPAGK